MNTKSSYANPTRNLLLAGISLAAIVWQVPGIAAAQTAKSDSADSNTVVVVTGYRASLQSSLNAKKHADVMLDAITSDDIASFPEANLAESLQRIPGISIDRDNGEGRQISVRGLGGDFTRVRINGMEALSTAGANDSGSSPNSSRAFDFNTFASELFSRVTVRKSASAETDEGSLGATVDLTTGHPFDYKGQKFVLSLEDAYYENGKHQNPRIAGLYSNRWFGGKLGFLVSGAYQQRDTSISSYARPPGSFDYTYRGTTWQKAKGITAPNIYGFAVPTGTDLSAYGITNPTAIAALTGSDPAAYAALYPDGTGTASLVRIPALATLNQQELHSERLGITSSLQWQVSDDTRVTVDYLHSRFRNESVNYQIQSVGLNRNNTNSTYYTATSKTSTAVKRKMYPGQCTPAAGSDITYSLDCGAQLYGTTPAFATGSDGKAAVLGTNIFSVNPNNLDPYDYYNNPNSVGYTPSSDGIGFLPSLMGRPATKVLAADVSNGVADYLQLGNVDWRSGADAAYYTTFFDQLSTHIDHTFNDRLHMTADIGASRSLNDQEGLLVEFNSMDRPETMTYDARGGGSMPLLDPGFDVSNSNNWGIVKGFSAMRHYRTLIENKYYAGKFDVVWDFTDHDTLKFGMTGRRYDFSSHQWQRPVDTLNPTEKEAGVTVASLGSVHDWGQGLSVPAGMPTSFFAPDLSAFSKTFGFDCNCVNKYGDFTISDKKNNTSQFGVQENDRAAYVQWDFNYAMPVGTLSGNLGLRQVATDVLSTGRDNKGRPLIGTHNYSDSLPSLNLNYQLTDNLYFRFAAAKVMARPLLGNLSPAVTAISVPSTGNTTGGTLSIGNPQLSPFRADDFDADVEWYFKKNALLSFAVFTKKVNSYPQTIIYSAPLSTFLSADNIAALRQQFTNPDQLAYIDGDNTFDARQYRDAPGGTLSGWEFDYQEDLDFLPGFLKNLGVQFNATHIQSKLTYILDPGSATKPQTLGSGPWLGASPDAVNFTLYYEVPQFTARVSVAKRSGYYTNYPIAAGACAPGACDSPLINDFAGSKGTTNVDAVFNWNFDEHLSARLEGLNLTNQTTNRYAYVANPVVTQYASTGRQITIGLRYKY
ncbi:TonB-dependent receptor [Asticcacaulis sp. EMRT-3]|uniref:TonB-dependent receptor domain-containing protein n=1 Tax=Asticcacaulis sp. EMRT-3 TaxID=3040349 RepID=UPI0024AF92E8|nr:TonB-dependent receptor [Asticcacaulis sp. EMRT-3]MDI7776496.1 TonB-dependent receptor [Asticcacaulis sp. EMRT-3]